MSGIRFQCSACGQHLEAPTFEERIEACSTHLDKAVEWKGEKIAINEMKRHYSNYFKNIPLFKGYRTNLVTSNALSEIKDIFEELKANAERFKMPAGTSEIYG